MAELKQKQQVWYRNLNVPAKTYNKKLGLENINVYPANELQKSYGIVCNATLVLVSGNIRVTIFKSKNNPDTIYLTPPGVERMGDNYYENVQLRYELKAQVLKYIESLMK